MTTLESTAKDRIDLETQIIKVRDLAAILDTNLSVLVSRNAYYSDRRANRMRGPRP
jgi:hypothetical protein